MQPPESWLSLQPPIWFPVAWWAALALSIVVSMVTDPLPACTAQTPCQPDAVFPLVVALAGISAIAIWWFPLTALAAGVGYGVLGILFDPSIPGRYAEALAGCVALGLLVTIRALRAKQADIAEGCSSPGSAGDLAGSLRTRPQVGLGRASAHRHCRGVAGRHADGLDRRLPDQTGGEVTS